MAEQSIEQLLFSIEDTALQLGLSVRSVWYMVKKREIESVKLGYSVRISKKTIQKLIDNGFVRQKKERLGKVKSKKTVIH